MVKKKSAKPQIDVSKHVLVPKHTKLTKKEQQELFDNYHISSAELLKIHKDDPAIFDLNAEEGDIIKIERKGSLQSPTKGTSYFYRGVIDAQK